MKKTIFTVILILTVLFFHSESFAEKIQVNIGLKGWINEWKINPEGGENSKSDNAVMLIGPNLKITYENIFGGISFMQNASDYDFPSEEWKWSRKDLDILLGYMLHQRVGIFAGYKYLTGTSGVTTEHTVDGLAFGVTFNYPLEKLNLVFFANGVYMPLKGEYTNNYPTTTKYDVNGYSCEGGAIYNLSNKISVNLGYKYQSFKWVHLADEITSGVTFGINYSF